MGHGEPKLITAFGERGGVFAGPKLGTLGPQRLAMPSAVSVDDAGNLHVSCTRFARAFSPAGDTWNAPRWQFHVIEFCTTADFDPASDGTEILTGHCRYSYRSGKEPGKDWELTGWNADARTWPDLSDSGGQVLVRRLNGGKLYRFAVIYDLNKLRYFPRPPEFVEVYRVWYYPSTDTLYLSGITWDHPALGTEQWGCCGREAIRYDGWLQGDRRLASRMVFPKGAVSIKAAQPAHDGNRFFAGEMETSVLFVYNATNGKLLGIVESDEQLFGGVGWIDTDSAVRPFVRSNREILVICEESAFQKQMIYRLRPPTLAPSPGGRVPAGR